MTPRRTGFLSALGVLLASAVLDFLGLLPGWWWVTLAVAFLVGLLLRGFWVFWLMVLGALIGWTAMLLWHGGGDISRIATLVGDIALNAPAHGWAAFVLTYGLALLLPLAGGWFGGAVRRLVRPTRRTTAAAVTE
jgi:hypothetical protein